MYEPTYIATEPTDMYYADYSYTEPTSTIDEYTWLNDSTGPTTASSEWTDMRFEDLPSTAKPGPTAENDGWALLVSGDAREARRAFSHSMNAKPGDSLPQVGYAISAALMDRDEEAVTVMRQALRTDAEALLEAPQDPTLTSAYSTLIDRYRGEKVRSMSPRDMRFMAAALLTLRGDFAAAYYSIDTDIEQGDSDVSAMNLKQVIRTALDRQENPAQAAPEAPATAPQSQGAMF